MSSLEWRKATRRIEKKIRDHQKRAEKYWSKHIEGNDFESGAKYNVELGRIQGFQMALGIICDCVGCD